METTVPAGADHLWAEDSGGDGPAVVLLHPGVADARVWDDIWPALTARCRVIRYDVRAYGRSPAATENYTLLGDLRQVLDHFEVTSAHLVGCSMGGDVSLAMALTDPGRVLSLTLLCPGISGYPYPEDAALADEAAALDGDEDGLIDLYRRMWAAAGAGPRVTELLRSAVRAGPNEEKYQQPNEPVFDRLGELRVPTVLLVGDRDYPPLVASNEAAAARIPGVQLIWMPGVDHLPSLREPALVAAAVLRQVSESAADDGQDTDQQGQAAEGDRRRE